MGGPPGHPQGDPEPMGLGGEYVIWTCRCAPNSMRNKEGKSHGDRRPDRGGGSLRGAAPLKASCAPSPAVQGPPGPYFTGNAISPREGEAGLDPC